MDYRSHELNIGPSNKAKYVFDKAFAEGHFVYIKYQETNGAITKRVIQPLKWVDGYKVRAYCEADKSEHDFVLSSIIESSVSVRPKPHITHSIPSTIKPHTFATQKTQPVSSTQKTQPVKVESKTLVGKTDSKLAQQYSMLSKLKYWLGKKFTK